MSLAVLPRATVLFKDGALGDGDGDNDDDDDGCVMGIRLRNV